MAARRTQNLKKKLSDYGGFFIILLVLLFLSMVALLLKFLCLFFPSLCERLEPAADAIEFTAGMFPAFAMSVAGLLILPVNQPLGIILLVSAAIYTVAMISYRFMLSDDKLGDGSEEAVNPVIGSPSE